MRHNTFADFQKIETDLWEAADQLRANSKLSSSEYCTEREKVKQASRSLLARLQELLAGMPHWTETAQTQAEIEIEILDRLWNALPTPPFTNDEKTRAAAEVYKHVWAISKNNPRAFAPTA